MSRRSGSSVPSAPWLRPRVVAAGIALLAIGWAGWLVWLVQTDPRVVYLAPEEGARWIVADDPVLIGTRYEGFYITNFRAWIPAGPTQDTVLTVRALRIVEVSIDGRPVFASPRELGIWKRPHRVPVRLEPSAQPRELRIMVVNESGPPALLAYAPALGVVTGPGWEAMKSRQTAWTPAIVAGPRLPELSRQFTRADEALLALAPVLLVVFAGVAAVSFASGRVPARLGVSPSAFRWLLVVAWGVLALNNLWKLPVDVGFDVEPHVDYIRYLVERRRFPLATEGLQMFQPPLYHLLSALFVWLPARPFVDDETLLRLLRLIPLACGAAQVELSYRAARLTFPARADLQRLGTLIGGLLPMNLYMSQYVGNEPLAGVLTAAAVVLLLRWVAQPETAIAGRSQWLLGVVLGLAVLTKPTAVLVVGPALLVLADAHARAGRRPVPFLGAGARVLGALTLVAGWYYVRNWILLGTPFLGVWDRSAGLGWWQEPGYRTLAHLASFGASFWFPVYGGLAGLWDAEYSSFWLDGWLSAVASWEHRPPWNYALMLPAPWLALLPTAAMVVGAASAIWRDPAERRGLALAVGLIAIYLAATISRYLQVPIFAAAKATQLLGLTPCFAILAVAGYEVLGRALPVRPLLYGATACWAFCALLAYFVR